MKIAIASDINYLTDFVKEYLEEVKEFNTIKFGAFKDKKHIN